MTNEEHIEEILFEAHESGIKHQVFELVNKLTKENPNQQKVNIYEKALMIAKKKKEELVYITN